MFDFALKCVTIAIALNIILPFILTPFASVSEIKPPNGAAMLSFTPFLI